MWRLDWPGWGLRRDGSAAWGNDPFGEFVLRQIRGEGVDTSRVVRDGQNLGKAKVQQIER
ncbi:hypothetical protein [Laceyella putida]|uniref:Uncharacterized protein n=1 Tax=Laceyella putida TaxID=110101 RepID=A0ABW2RLX7_9BACL